MKNHKSNGSGAQASDHEQVGYASGKKRIMKDKKKTLQVVMLATLVIVTGLIGLRLLVATNAAMSNVSLETETGTMTAPVEVVADSTASGGKAVKFGSAAANTLPVLLNTDFESTTVAAPMVLSEFKTAMGDPTVYAGASNLVNTSVRTEAGHGKYMRQGLTANDVGGSNGIVVLPKLKTAVDEASIEYDIRFVGAFDWSGGGKIPGLGGSSNADPNSAAGCNDGLSTSWSGRGMWIGPKSYPSVTGSNEFIGYMYNVFKPNPGCGVNQRTGKAFVANQWHKIKQYYKMNTVTNGVANADGLHKMWLDGTLIKSTSNYMYRDNTNLRANYLFWTIFRGGKELDIWASPTMGYIDFDNLVIEGR